jgi:hypothetical protein
MDYIANFIIFYWHIKKLNIEKLEKKSNEIWVTFFQNNFEKIEELVSFSAKNIGKVFLRQDVIVYRIFNSTGNICSIVEEFLKRL